MSFSIPVKGGSIHLDKEKNSFKRTYKILGFIPASDGWEKIRGNPVKVLMTKVTMKQKGVSTGGGAGVSGANPSANKATDVQFRQDMIYLITDRKGAKLEVYTSEDTEKCREIASKVAGYLNIPFENRSETEG